MIEVTIRTKKIDVGVFDNGMFHAEVGGAQYTAATLEELKQKLTVATRTSISIPFCRWDGEKVVNGTITGKHASNSNYLVKIDGEKGTKQESHWGRSNANFLRPLSMAQTRDYAEMQKQRRELRGRIEAFEKDHQFDVRAEVEKAYAEAE